MIKFIYNNSIFNWLQLSKIGSTLILIGLLIFLFKDVIIFIIASLFIIIGLYILLLAFKAWKKTY
ncbi:MAG: hypothetical protein CMG00_01950 [Candidatus Marinimicrobia bacterium]|nr:hypothetical protein [Candidatus Neomarinimicrobiota bacterium]